MHRRVHPGHLPPCHPADAAGDGRHHRLRHWQGDVIISQKKRRPGRESPSGPAQSQHFQRTVLYYRLFSNSANIFRLRTTYRPDFPSCPFRSIFPYGSRFGQRRTAKANRSKEFSKMKKPCKSHGFARLCDVLTKKMQKKMGEFKGWMNWHYFSEGQISSFVYFIPQFCSVQLSSVVTFPQIV